MRFFRPRIFISYAREDAALATALRDALAARGFIVFVDSDEMMAGEDFVRRLREELRRADAVVALFTRSSIASEWCTAEWYFAHARGATVIPIRFGDIEDALPAPVKLLEARVHFLSSGDLMQFHRVTDDLTKQLELVRTRRRWRVLAFGLSAAAGVALLILAAIAMSERLDRFTRTRERNALVQRVTTAVQPLAGDAVIREGEKFAGDDALLSTSLRLASDSYAADATRLNALMLSTDLLRRKRSERRWFVKAAYWRNGVLDSGSVTDVTFFGGTIENLRVRNATLAGVWWNEAVSLSNSEFVGVKFDAGAFAGTNVSNVKFADCVFRGTEIDVTNFSLVTFGTTPPDPRYTNVVTPNVTAFENSVVLSRAPAPEPGVMDLSNPVEEVQFRDVVFTGVRFRGRMRPEWFVNCSFDRCTLPSTLPLEALEKGGSHVTDSQWSDESLD